MKKAEVSPVEDPELRMLESKLGIAFKDKRLLVQALTHSSAVNETDLGDSMSNERLEFLGDALIGLVIAQLLFESVKDFNEGDLTSLRSQIVRGSTLQGAARGLCPVSYTHLTLPTIYSV